MRCALLLLPLLFAACVTDVRYLREGDRPPADAGTIVGSMPFQGWGVHRQMAFLDGRGQSLVIKPRLEPFACVMAPGDYRVDYIDRHRWEDPRKPRTRAFTVKAGEVVYIGTWQPVLGLSIDLRDDLEALRPVLERRYGKLDIRTDLPGGAGVFGIEVDPQLDPLEDRGK